MNDGCPGGFALTVGPLASRQSGQRQRVAPTLPGPGSGEWKALGVGPLEPIAPGMQSHVMVEMEATEEEARGAFTLKLWSQEGGGGGELFDGVTFP